MSEIQRIIEDAAKRADVTIDEMVIEDNMIDVTISCELGTRRLTKQWRDELDLELFERMVQRSFTAWDGVRDE